jgi:hypothetical protein
VRLNTEAAKNDSKGRKGNAFYAYLGEMGKDAIFGINVLFPSGWPTAA